MSTVTERDPRTAIRTISGHLFYPLEPREEEILLEDIGHALSHLCRFVGHTRSFYSVAQHSVLVSKLVPPADALWALLHDASEAYLNDIARPLKHTSLLADYRAAETKLQALIYRRFGLKGEEPESVKLADQKALHAEIRDLVINGNPLHVAAAEGVPIIYAQKPEFARHIFLERFRALLKAA